MNIQRKRIRQLFLLASLDLDVVRHSSQIAHNALVARRIGGERLGGGQAAGDEDDLDGVGLVVVDFDDGVDGAVVDEFDAEDVGGVGEGGFDVGVKDGGVDGGDGLLSGVLMALGSQYISADFFSSLEKLPEQKTSSIDSMPKTKIWSVPGRQHQRPGQPGGRQETC
jgi:hypothetical protein